MSRMKYLVALEIESPTKLRLKDIERAFTAERWLMEDLDPVEIASRVMNVVAIRQIKPRSSAK